MTSDVITSHLQMQPNVASKVPVHQHVYENLRTMILFGDLAPGQAVTIQGLTTQLDAGMTPVREALRRLIAEGALTLQGNRRVNVPVLTSGCVEELGFVRKTLEPELARRACGQIPEDIMFAIRSADDDLNAAIAQGDIGGYLRQNHRFHTLIYACADAPILTETVDRLWLRFGPSLRVVCGRFGTNSLPDKHTDILAALQAKDSMRAAEAMAEDTDQGMRQIKAALEEQQMLVDSIDRK